MVACERRVIARMGRIRSWANFFPEVAPERVALLQGKFFMISCFKSALALLFLIGVRAASAASLTYSGSLAGPFVSERVPGTESFADPLFQLIALQQFDPALGTLTGVTVYTEMTGSASGVLHLCTRQGTSCDSERIAFELRVTGFQGTSPMSTTDSANFTCDAAPGIMCGPDPKTIALNLVSTRTVAPSALGPYTGTGSFDVALQYLPGWTFNARVNSVSASNLFAGVTYTYDEPVNPVPLPAGLPLLLSGPVALWFLARRKRRAAS